MRIPGRLREVAARLWREQGKPLAITAAIILPFKSAIADLNWVPSGSMKPTILEGDLVYVNKLAYDLKVPFTLLRVAEWDNPSRGDIVIFFSPEDGRRFVKRVVAVPGDTVAMRNNLLFLNGERSRYQVENNHPFSSELYEDPNPVIAREKVGADSRMVMSLPSRFAIRDFPEVTVPSGKYFMLGDCRDNSRDSRFFGFIDREQIVGKANGVVASFDKNHYYVPRTERLFTSFYE